MGSVDKSWTCASHPLPSSQGLAICRFHGGAEALDDLSHVGATCRASGMCRGASSWPGPPPRDGLGAGAVPSVLGLLPAVVGAEVPGHLERGRPCCSPGLPEPGSGKPRA